MSKKLEPMLRIQNGYATKDGRFFADRVAGGRWRCIDAIRSKSVEQGHDTLRACRVWIQKRRKVHR